MIHVTRKEHFNAAHKLFNPNWSKEKNEEVFGLCSNENWHGHNYELFVTVKGEIDPDTGYVCDMKALSSLIKEEITKKVDHKNLNMDVPFMKDVIPSTENFIVKMWEILENKLPTITKAKLHHIRLYETERNFVDYYG